MANGLTGLALFPTYRPNPYAIAIGVALGVLAVPRKHWARAIVGAHTLAAIIVFSALARIAIRGQTSELESRASLALGFATLYMLPFGWWLWYSRRRASGPRS
jgi:hypothetical protein